MLSINFRSNFKSLFLIFSLFSGLAHAASNTASQSALAGFEAYADEVETAYNSTRFDFLLNTSERTTFLALISIPKLSNEITKASQALTTTTEYFDDSTLDRILNRANQLRNIASARSVQKDSSGVQDQNEITQINTLFINFKAGLISRHQDGYKGYIARLKKLFEDLKILVKHCDDTIEQQDPGYNYNLRKAQADLYNEIMIMLNSKMVNTILPTLASTPDRETAVTNNPKNPKDIVDMPQAIAGAGFFGTYTFATNPIKSDIPWYKRILNCCSSKKKVRNLV